MWNMYHRVCMYAATILDGIYNYFPMHISPIAMRPGLEETVKIVSLEEQQQTSLSSVSFVACGLEFGEGTRIE